MQRTANFTRIFPLYIFVPPSDKPYHENGTPMAFAFYTEGTAPVYYFYELNLQGDIIGIYDENGAKVVGFRYDAWGNFNTDKSNTTVCTDLFLRASLFRYRSYIYDYETDLYYLQSRYYDYEIGRFINADGYVNANGDLIGYNMYAYCSNNPINFFDNSGKSAIAVIVGAIVIGLIAVTAKPHTVYDSDKKVAEEAAINNVTYKYDSERNTVDIIIDMENKPELYTAELYFTDLIYQNALLEAKKNNASNIMSLWHIQWEYNFHKVAYYSPIPSIHEAGKETYLNYEETVMSMLKRAIRGVFN